MAKLIINQEKEIDFTDYVNDRTQDFTGREWLFRLIQNWLADANGSRYFLLKGEPGSGKTAIAGQIVKNALAQKAAAQAPFPHAAHFCSASRLSWIVPTNFAESIALQLAQIEEYAKALLEIDTKQVIISSTQSVGTAINSSMTVGLSKDEFVSAVGAKSDGNFLYITYLLKMLTQEQTEISKAVIDKLPNGLDGIYQEFLYRLVGKERKTWRNQYAPVLGTLAVVQEAISKEQLAKFVDMGKSEVKGVLEDILQFLDVDDTLPISQRTYIIYHRSLADFLFDEDRAEYYFCGKTEQLQRIIDYYKKMSQSWE